MDAPRSRSIVAGRLEIRPGAAVFTTEGRAGEVLHVVVSPRERRATALIVRLEGGRAVQVPVERVADATETTVRLALSRAELETLAAWEPDRYTPAALSWPGWRGLRQRGALLALPTRGHRRDGMARRLAGEAERRPEEPSATISRGQRVLCADGPIGRVDLVLVDATSDRVQHLVVRRGVFFSRDVAVPADWIRSITPEAVVLEAAREAVARLPVYRPDDELQADVEEALLREELVRVLDLPVRAEVADGVVRLRGHVHNHALRTRLEELVRSVPGVMEIQNELAVDLDVLQEVVAAVQRHPRARGLTGYEIRVVHGVVELRGSVPSLDDARALEEAIASVPAVRGIANHLTGPEIPDTWRRVVQPSPGQTVFATDQELGHVAAVVVDPRNRRVAAVVVDAQAPTPPGALQAEPVPQTRRVVVPVSDVERVTPVGVSLRVPAAEAAGYPALEEADYPAPPPQWTPPFPYERGDVRVPRAGGLPGRT